MYPKLIKAGTIILVGPVPGNDTRAYGVEYKINQDVEINDEGVGRRSSTGEVLNNPNGWHSDTLNHRIKLEYDRILYETNKEAKHTLERFDD